MAMVGADAIYADHGSLIGSIGVLGPSLTYFNKPIATDGGLFGGGMARFSGGRFDFLPSFQNKGAGAGLQTSKGCKGDMALFKVQK